MAMEGYRVLIVRSEQQYCERALHKSPLLGGEGQGEGGLVHQYRALSSVTTTPSPPPSPQEREKATRQLNFRPGHAVLNSTPKTR